MFKTTVLYLQSTFLLIISWTNVFGLTGDSCTGEVRGIFRQSPFSKKRLSPSINKCDDLDKKHCSPGRCKTEKNSLQGVICKCLGAGVSYTSFNASEGLYRVSCVDVYENPCNFCHKRFTKSCSVLNRSAALCSCVKGYDPYTNCETLIDTCISQLEHSITGNEACNVKNGNKCVSVLGASYYCICNYPYRENKDLIYANCRLQTGACHRKLCARSNQCNAKTKACDCHSGFYGDYCEKEKDVAKQMWSSWSVCAPACANFGFKTSLSGCISGVNSMFCEGTLKLWRRCLPQGCGFTLDSKDSTGRLTMNSDEWRSIILIIILGSLTVASILICLAELSTKSAKNKNVMVGDKW